MTYSINLEHFVITRYRLSLEASDGIELPHLNPGIALQKEFGAVFRRVVCHNLKDDCLECAMHLNCAFGMIFNPKIPLEAKSDAFSRDIPYPFVIKPFLRKQNNYIAGDRIHFEFLLIGKAQWFLPYFLAAFEKLGKRGIGPRLGAFQILNLEACNKQNVWESVYNRQDHMVRLPENQFQFHPSLSRFTNKPQQVRIRFLTPISLKSCWNGSGDFWNPFFKQLLHQIQALSFFYCSRRFDPDAGFLERLAASIEIGTQDLHWTGEWTGPKADRSPDPSRGGFIGALEIKGVPEPLLALLDLGAWIHVGEANAFGQGWYVLENKPC